MSNIAEQVKVLRHGEEMETGRGFYAPASITLIRHPIVHSCYVLVDTGCFGETNLVKNLLKREDVHPNQIRTVYVTHNHPDHIGTIGLFKNSRVYTPDSKFSVREPNYFKLMPQEFYTEPGKPLDVEDPLYNLRIISTPGHAGQDFSVTYHDANGRIAVVGDLFWSKDDWEHDSEFMGLCVNPEMQKRSRAYIRETLKPEVIIPGHGPAFEPKY